MEKEVPKSSSQKLSNAYGDTSQWWVSICILCPASEQTLVTIFTVVVTHRSLTSLLHVQLRHTHAFCDNGSETKNMDFISKISNQIDKKSTKAELISVPSSQQFISEDSKRPKVGGKVVTFVKQYLGCNILWRATKCPRLVSKAEMFSKPKVNLQVATVELHAYRLVQCARKSGILKICQSFVHFSSKTAIISARLLNIRIGFEIVKAIKADSPIVTITVKFPNFTLDWIDAVPSNSCMLKIPSKHNFKSKRVYQLCIAWCIKNKVFWFEIAIYDAFIM